GPGAPRSRTRPDRTPRARARRSTRPPRPGLRAAARRVSARAHGERGARLLRGAAGAAAWSGDAGARARPPLHPRRAARERSLGRLPAAARVGPGAARGSGAAGAGRADREPRPRSDVGVPLAGGAAPARGQDRPALLAPAERGGARGG